MSSLAQAFLSSTEVTDEGFTLVDANEARSTAPTRPNSNLGAARPTSNVGLALTRCESLRSTTAADMMVTITPPQTHGTDTPPTKGAHTLVIDVSYSMDDEAKITNDDGDKCSHGFSLLDVVKHAACTYIQSLTSEDYLSIVTYATNAQIKMPWRQCDDAGKKALDAAVRALRTEGQTNLREGIEVGMRTFGSLPDEVAAAPQDYAMLLAVCTDGCPSASTHPAGGVKGYAAHVEKLRLEVEEAHGVTAVPSVTAIGFGNNLDSPLLNSFSDTFLHLPDPGSVGPFMVNLLAAARSTAKLTDGNESFTATHTRLILEPASAVADVPGYQTEPWRDGSAVAVNLGSLLYDGLRHVLVKPGEGNITASLAVSGHELAATSAVTMLPTADANFTAQIERTKVFMALQNIGTGGTMASAEYNGVIDENKVAALRTLSDVITDGTPLKKTLVDEMILACQPDKYVAWGRHYVRTLPQMLRSERRSNFRDACLQAYGHDAKGRQALFEDLSNEAEQCFATLKPPAPSLLGRRGPHGGGGPARAAPMNVMPDEFMRGGGCFGPNATVLVARDEDLNLAWPHNDTEEGLPPRRSIDRGGPERVPVSKVKAGDMLVCDDGRLAPVRCVVMTECAGGKAQLTRLPNGTEITEWHPLFNETTMRWQFPNMIGQRVIVNTQYVYNFVLAPGFPTILVDGIPCAALGHGLEAPIVAHPYWGTAKVVQDLMTKPGWAEGKVVLPAGKKSAWEPDEKQ